MGVERNPIGKFCQDISKINEAYEYLENEKTKYERYDGGQGEFENTETYKNKIKEINKLETNVSRYIKHVSKPTRF